MSVRLKKILKYLLSAGVAVALLYFSFKDVNWNDFLESLGSCRWGYVLLAMLSGVVAFYIRALRWRMLLLPIDPSISRLTAFNAINIGYVANLALPRAGEFIRCGYVAGNSAADEEGRKKATFDKVLGTAIVDRLWDVLTMLLLILLLVWSMRERFGHFFYEKLISPILSKLQLDLSLLILFSVLLAGAAAFAIIRFRNSNVLCGKVFGFFSRLWNGVKSCMRMDRSWIFFVYTILIWGLYWLISFSTLKAVEGIDISSLDPSLAGSMDIIMGLDWVDTIFLMLVGALSSVIPVPGGFGTFHSAVSLALSAVYGIAPQLGIVFAILSHESQTIIQIICGLSSYAYETLKKR